MGCCSDLALQAASECWYYFFHRPSVPVLPIFVLHLHLLKMFWKLKSFLVTRIPINTIFCILSAPQHRTGRLVLWFIPKLNITKLSSSWPVPVKANLNWDLHYNHWHPLSPPTPTSHLDKDIWATSRLPRELKFGMEAVFNQTRSITLVASYPLATTSCS